MNKYLLIFLLYGIWIVLAEGFTITALAAGIAASIASIYLYYKYLPTLPYDLKNINIFLFILYPFYLIGQIYISAFNSIRLIISGSKVNVIKVKTNISNNFLRTVIANSFTLTPGSISLDINDNEITILWLTSKNKTYTDAKNDVENMLSKLEKKFIRKD